MVRDYRRALLVIYKDQIGSCLTHLKSLKGKTDQHSNEDREYHRVVLSTNVKTLARFRKDNPDITGPRCRQLSFSL